MLSSAPKRPRLEVFGHEADGNYVTVKMAALADSASGRAEGRVDYELPVAMRRQGRLVIGQGFIENKTPKLAGLGVHGLEHIQQAIFSNMARQEGMPVVHQPVTEEGPLRKWWERRGYRRIGESKNPDGTVSVVLEKEFSGEEAKPPTEKEREIIARLLGK